jgi:hypothetical protein
VTIEHVPFFVFVCHKKLLHLLLLELGLVNFVVGAGVVFVDVVVLLHDPVLERKQDVFVVLEVAVVVLVVPRHVRLPVAVLRSAVAAVASVAAAPAPALAAVVEVVSGPFVAVSAAIVELAIWRAPPLFAIAASIFVTIVLSISSISVAPASSFVVSVPKTIFRTPSRNCIFTKYRRKVPKNLRKGKNINFIDK